MSASWQLEMFCRFKALGNWETVARNAVQWDALLPSFQDLFHVNAATTFSARRLQVVQSLVCTYIYFFFRLRPYIGLAYGRWG